MFCLFQYYLQITICICLTINWSIESQQSGLHRNLINIIDEIVSQFSWIFTTFKCHHHSVLFCLSFVPLFPSCLYRFNRQTGRRLGDETSGEYGLGTGWKLNDSQMDSNGFEEGSDLPPLLAASLSFSTGRRR